MKKVFKIILLILLLAVLAVTLLWHGEIASIRTVHSVGDKPYLYSMQYKASYDLDEVIASDIGSNKDLLAYVVKKIGKGIPIKMKSDQVNEEDDGEHDRCCDGGDELGENNECGKHGVENLPVGLVQQICHP